GVLSSAMADDLRVGLDWSRLADEVPLHFIAGFAGQETKLLLRLDSFGNDRQAKSAGEAYHRPHDRGRLRIALQVGYECLIDLDRIEGKGLQIRERGISGAEVVHRDLHAHGFEAAKNGERARKVADQHAFGNFKLQPARAQAGFDQHRMNESGQITMAELNGGQIDRDLEIAPP